MIQLVLVSTIIGFPVQIHQEISGNKCSLQDTMTTDPPNPELKSDPPCVRVVTVRDPAAQ